MVVLNLVIESKSEKDFHIECNLLKREDAKDNEWQFAKLMEGSFLNLSKMLSSEVKNEKHID